MLKLENGQSVSKYCHSNKIPYDCIWGRITFKGMTPDEAVEDYWNKKDKPRFCKHYYKGATLSQYCKQHGLPYQRIVDRMNLYKYTVEEVVDWYEKNKNRKQQRFFYHGKPLKQACAELGLQYVKIINAYNRYNRYNVNKKPCTIEQLVDYFLTTKK